MSNDDHSLAPGILAVRDGYAAWAETYDSDGNPLVALEGPAVQGLMGRLDGLHVIDIGCGTGRHTSALIDAGASQVVALDCTPEMMARARVKLSGRPVDWLLHRLPDPFPFREGMFELAVMGLVAEHIADITTALGEVARVLAPGGRLILSALHPHLTAQGQTARYIDPVTGARRPILTVHRDTADYLRAARSVGLDLEGELTLSVPPELATTHPRAERYIGQRLGWVGHWSRPGGADRPASTAAGRTDF